MTDIDGTDAAEGAIEVEPGSIRDDLSFARPDPFLQSLVALANNPGVGLDVTLLVDGLVVTGETIPHAMFWNEQADDMEGWTPGASTDADSADVALMAAKAFAEVFRGRANEAAALAEDESESAFLPRYIHLRNATIHSPGQVRNVGLWRGRLSAVSGWSLGR